MNILEYMAGNPWVTALIVVCITVAICSAFEAIGRMREPGVKTINVINKAPPELGKFYPNRDANGRLYPPRTPVPASDPRSRF